MIMDFSTHYIVEKHYIHGKTSKIHGRVTLHGFSPMIVIHDSSMICNVEKFVQMFELANLANLA